jgi:hypothetical protein
MSQKKANRPAKVRVQYCLSPDKADGDKSVDPTSRNEQTKI